MPDGEYGLLAPVPAGSASPSALADNQSVSRIERNTSTILSAGDARFAGRDTLLQGPIASRLIGLAFPILIVLAVQTLVSVAETYFVGFLGDDALAGVALVFPILMLMTMMSNGGIGGRCGIRYRAPHRSGPHARRRNVDGPQRGYRRRIRCGVHRYDIGCW